MTSKLPSDNFIVDSCGTGNWHIGNQPDLRSISISRKKGLDITNQKCRQFITSDFDTFDYIYVMDKSNYKDVIALSQNEKQKSKVQLILNELFPNENRDVPDPYFGLENGFEIVYKMLDETCEIIAKKLIEKHS